MSLQNWMLAAPAKIEGKIKFCVGVYTYVMKYVIWVYTGDSGRFQLYTGTDHVNDDDNDHNNYNVLLGNK